MREIRIRRDMPRAKLKPEDRKNAIGQGRKPFLPPTIRVEFALPKAHAEQIDASGQKRSEFIRAAIEEKLSRTLPPSAP
jgi:hypothetical protein